MGTLNQYYIEQSNVNVAEELVNLIASQRAYEINTRAVTATDQILQRVSNMGQ
jgi:flagellar basal-body rod protein FlgG